MVNPNDIQIGGDHYKVGGEEHWDRAFRLDYDPFQYIITKWVERHKKKGGLQDLEKARHALDKYIVLIQAEEDKLAGIKAGAFTPGSRKDPAREVHFEGEEPGPDYVNQD